MLLTVRGTALKFFFPSNVPPPSKEKNPQTVSRESEDGSRNWNLVKITLKVRF